MKIQNRFTAIIAMIGLALSGVAFAQSAGTNRERLSVLRAPAGAKAAIVVFEDLQCPDCARAAPVIQEMKKKYKIPVLRHDFPLPRHNFSFDAAVIGRYFDTKSEKIGDAWRAYIFANQTSISPANLQAEASKFAKANGLAMPFALDPDGKLAAKVTADYQLGQRIGIQHTPTIFIVNNNNAHGDPFVEVVDRANISSLIEEMIRKAK